ncbi:Flp family type IVb pilin [Dyella kyungheensis]|jgi:pilus assembly protein Flp/PilA|uniref:Flp family type IVb pilin n=1 Tax=Dyella kyungheensis TaxID=1242174 RepID=UPI003CEFE807
MNTMIRNFLVEEDGITAIEYGILAAIVAAAIVAVFGSKLQDLFTTLFTNLTAVANTAVKSS